MKPHVAEKTRRFGLWHCFPAKYRIVKVDLGELGVNGEERGNVTGHL